MKLQGKVYQILVALLEKQGEVVTREELRQRLFVVYLRSDYDHRRVGVRFDVTGDLLDQAGVQRATIQARGKSRLAQMLSAVHFGDYVSLYLAYLYGTDPTPVGAISYLKEQLAKA